MKQKDINAIIEGLGNILWIKVRFSKCKKLDGKDRVIMYPLEKFTDTNIKDIVKNAKELKAEEWWTEGYEFSYRG